MSQKLHLKRPGNVSFEEGPIKCHMNAHRSAFKALCVIHAFSHPRMGKAL